VTRYTLPLICALLQKDAETTEWHASSILSHRGAPDATTLMRHSGTPARAGAASRTWIER